MTSSINWLKALQNIQVWLLGIAAALIALQLHWSWKSDNADQVSISLFLWSGVLYLLWQKRNTLRLSSGPLPSLAGLFLIALMLARSLWVRVPDDLLVAISPLTSAIGLGLIASGFRGLRQYGREYLLIFVLVIPRVVVATLLEQLLNLNLMAAKVAHFMLWYLGFDVLREGVNVILPTGVIEINSACSGLDSMLILLRLAVLFLVVFPTPLSAKFLVPVAAVSLAFLVNGVRIAIMALLVAFSTPEAFEFWHQGSGAQLFSLVTMLLFGWFCHALHQSSLSQSQSSAPV